MSSWKFFDSALWVLWADADRPRAHMYVVRSTRGELVVVPAMVVAAVELVSWPRREAGPRIAGCSAAAGMTTTARSPAGGHTCQVRARNDAY
jgi:hypothetical protein